MRVPRITVVERRREGKRLIVLDSHSLSNTNPNLVETDESGN